MGIVDVEDPLVGFWQRADVSSAAQLLDADEPLLAESAANLSPPELLELLELLDEPPPLDDEPSPSLTGGLLFVRDAASRNSREFWMSSRGSERACPSDSWALSP
jgi:hypothetical protein